ARPHPAGAGDALRRLIQHRAEAAVVPGQVSGHAVEHAPGRDPGVHRLLPHAASALSPDEALVPPSTLQGRVQAVRGGSGHLERQCCAPTPAPRKRCALAALFEGVERGSRLATRGAEADSMNTDVRRNPALLKLDLYCKGMVLDDSCLVEEDGGRKVMRTRAGLGSGLELLLP